MRKYEEERSIYEGPVDDLGANIGWIFQHADVAGRFSDKSSRADWTRYTQQETIAHAMGMNASSFTRAKTGQRGVSAAELLCLFEHLRLDRHRPSDPSIKLEPSDLRLKHADFVALMRKAEWGRPNPSKWLRDVPARQSGLALFEEQDWHNADLIQNVLKIDTATRDLKPQSVSSFNLPVFHVDAVVAVGVRLRGRQRALIVDMNPRGHLHLVPGPNERGHLSAVVKQPYALTNHAAVTISEPVGECLLFALLASEEAPRQPLFEIIAHHGPSLSSEEEGTLRELLEDQPRPSWLTVYRFSYRIR